MNVEKTLSYLKVMKTELFVVKKKHGVCVSMLNKAKKEKKKISMYAFVVLL